MSVTDGMWSTTREQMTMGGAPMSALQADRLGTLIFTG